MNGRYYVGEWLVEPEQNRLVRGSESAKLDPKAVQVLSFLAAHSNEVLTKEQIIDSVWDGAFVSDEVLTTAIWGLRKALGDDAKEPRYIQTIPRRGYRLIAPVEKGVGEAARWEPSPYPGLSSFSQRDAQFFFGREQEIEVLWRKIHERHLLGLIGPSGAGKSSLLRAGLIPAAPEGWDVVLSQPRAEALERLSRALDETGNTRTLWIVDQFEELFTLQDQETQLRFAEVVGRASESGIHILLSMRDDFLIRCHAHPPLESVFKDLTPVLPLEGAALRRALVEPARASGYRFEDEVLVSEILTEVSQEKGALPLLAFAASKLWEKRDREGRKLTREAYLSIGGVAGALAKHAEETLSSIGLVREPLVREVFRNLTSSHGTRVPTEREELLSVFPHRETAAAVLGELIEARLLTSSERNIEIVHESLLTAWPRLVRWQTQDADAAVLRDQLRQAARHWEERRRPRELLWTGTPYREFELWRERYAGGLTSLEGAYATAMVAEARRRRRRQLTAVGVTIGLLLAGVGVMSSLWRRAVHEAERREAAQVLALGRLEFDDNPTAALAYSLASLERADSDDARRFALEALWHGAAAIVLPGNINEGDFSPDGKWLATGGIYAGIHLWSSEGGPSKPLGEGRLPQFSPRSDFLAAWEETGARFWSVPDGGAITNVELEGATAFFRRGSHLLSLSTKSDAIEVVRDWRRPGEDPGILTSLDFLDLGGWDIDASGQWFARGLGTGVYASPLRDPSRNRARLIGTHESKIVSIASHPTASRVASGDETGEIRIWSLSEGSQRLERTFRAPVPSPQVYLDPGSSWMIAAAGGAHSNSEAAYLWDLKGPPDAEPVVLRNGNVKWLNRVAVDPEGRWFLYAESNFGVLWPLDSKHARVLRGQAPPFIVVRFTPDGRSLLSTSDDGTVRLWPMSFQSGARSSLLLEGGGLLGPFMSVDPLGRYVLVGDRFRPRVFLVPLEGGEIRQMPGFTEGEGWVGSTAFSPDGRLAVAAGVFPSVLRIWDLDSKEVRTLDTRVPGEAGCNPEKYRGFLVGDFLADGLFLSHGDQGIRIWDLKRGTSRQIQPCREEQSDLVLSLDRARRRAVVATPDAARRSEFGVLDVETGAFRAFPSHGSRISSAALDPSGTIAVTGDFDGVVRVGPIGGGEPHLLYGHALEVSSVAVSPDGKWIASGSQDGTIRLWPMPEGPPFHTLPYEEILKRIRGLTNLRVVPDETAGSGYRVEVGPFPGWKSLPPW